MRAQHLAAGLTARLERERDATLTARHNAIKAIQDAEKLERWREEILTAGWWRRRRLLREG